MMRFGVTIFALVICIGSALGQSGRVKTEPTPTPAPLPTYYPPVRSRISVSPTPTPTPAPRPTPSNTDDDGDVIKVESTLVPIPVTVTDRNGIAVSDLKLSDFELLIDGKTASISDVVRSESPIRLAMLFDNSSSVLVARDFEREAAVRFFKRVIRPDRDMAALFSVQDYTRLEQPLTRDVSLLVRAIQTFADPAGATALLDGIVMAAHYLKDADGRRVIVIVSDGEDTYSRLETTLDSVLKVLQIDNIQVYVVRTSDFENYKRTGIRGGNANTRSLTAERRMNEISSQTGGAVHSPIDEREMNAAFQQISADLSQQYILSYYPDDARTDAGRQRTITIRIKRSDLTIRTRKAYFVGKI